MEQRKVYLELSKREKRDIEFDNLSYSVKNNKGKKQILTGLSGSFKSGELTAIMGPSGAGKSSLLNILSGFQKNGMSGIIRCSGQEEKATDKVTYNKDTCYIMQDDNICPLFTVWETMMFAAKLKLGSSIPEKSRTWLISSILETLGLTSTMHTRCSRISGGQRKRLSIALELIDNPPIMFLDEPTTGLDSLSSYQCISVLKDLARDGRAIICTIHQPSASIFEMFDHVYVLAGGQCLYQGTALNTVPFLAAVGLDCPKYHNPADHLIEVANHEYGNYNDTLVKVTQDSNWRVPLQSNEKYTLQAPRQPVILNNAQRTMVLVQKPSEFYRFRILLARNMLQLYRDWTILHLRMILHVLVGLFIGLLYFDYGNDGSKTLKNIGYFIISMVYLSYTTMMPAVVKLPSEVSVLKKESFNNWYKLRTFYLSFTLVHLPVQVLFALVYSVSSYFISGQSTEISRFCMYTLVLVLSTLVAESIGVVLGTSVNPINGTFLGAIITAFFLVVAGFLMLFTHMSKIMYALSYISYLAYGMEGCVEAMYNGRANLPCPDDEVYCHMKSPNILLQELGMDKGNYNYDLLFLFCHILIGKIVGFYTLRRKLRMHL